MGNYKINIKNIQEKKDVERYNRLKETIKQSVIANYGPYLDCDSKKCKIKFLKNRARYQFSVNIYVIILLNYSKFVSCDDNGMGMFFKKISYFLEIHIEIFTEEII